MFTNIQYYIRRAFKGENMKHDFSLGISLGIYPSREVFSACAEAGIRYIELAPHDDDYRRIFAEAEKMKQMASE